MNTQWAYTMATMVVAVVAMQANAVEPAGDSTNAVDSASVATEPKPANGGCMPHDEGLESPWVPGTRTLRSGATIGTKRQIAWKPAANAVKQNVYIGPNTDEVRRGGRPALMGIPATPQAFPLPLEEVRPGMRINWRVESLDKDGKVLSPGDIWSFRVVKKKIKIYLLGGQSNMSGCSSSKDLPEALKRRQDGAIIFVRGRVKVGMYGWDAVQDGLGDGYGDEGFGTFGPEVTFAQEMAPRTDDEIIGLIKCAWGATNLKQQWLPPSINGKAGDLYTGFVKAVREGLAALDPGFEPVIAGMLWMQGEADALEANMYGDYETNLTVFISDIRKEFQRPDLPFVIGEIADAAAYKPPKWGKEIRTAQSNVAAKVTHTAIFGTSDFKLRDPWHYDAAGMIELGKRFAKAMKGFEGQATEQPADKK